MKRKQRRHRFASKRLRAKLDDKDKKLDIGFPSSHAPLSQVSSQKLLGVILDDDLTFDDHVEALSNKVSKRIGLFKKIKSFLPYKERLTYYTATIKPVIMYGSAVWTLTSKSNIETVFKLQERAARSILDTDCKSRSLPLFNQLKWIPFYEESKLIGFLYS